MTEQFSLVNQSTQTSNDTLYKQQMEQFFAQASGTVVDKLQNFSRFTSRQSLSLFLAKNEIFQHILPIHGNIVECGVFMGGGLFTWAQLSAIYEPINHGRKVIGFDSFDGFPALGEQDQNTGAETEHKVQGSYRFEHMAELEKNIGLFDLNRPLGHISKMELVKGDALQTIPQYMADNKHLVVALLYLDFDLYEPTKAALKHFLPRMPKGAVIAFDELNQKQWPGETLAVLEEVGINNIRIQRVPYTPSLSYAIL
ncbi:TylF/MycF/NovP-related O-methyltransferase [Rheinheimera nanhaiensis]|uniref:dTDP-6-deoxy-L-hexose 3-O-methyltransferase n=1 Tax=Rheinheimera nanhaiensis E407-8 TaxID=562729 RepID=I1DWK8_9GAMM|nr:TylF/MycF/NovP-related O-methyltransferase [Rheinheimera nanhaiensis]GAB58436.1 dTDP-6-deoxy-L-hexose 3-O-methyltransferase [Rheinheimera nanhaiensis E407-8]